MEEEKKQAAPQPARREKKRGLTSIFIHRPVTTIMLSAAVVVLGLMSYSSMGVGMFPNIDIPYVLVQTSLAGASPEEVETSITKVIEESVNQVEGIDEIKSQSMEGSSLVSIKFDMDKDRDVAAQEVRDKVELIKNDLPDGTDAPIVQKLDMDAIAVLNVVVSGDRDIVDLTEVAKNKVKENIENIRGVGSVNIVGGREREIHVIVNPFKLFALNLPISDVSQALSEQNVEIPGGRVEQEHEEYTLRILGRIPTVQAFNDVFIAKRKGASIKISDIGYAEDSGEYERESSWLNKRRSVTLEVTKQSGTNTLAVVQGVKDKLELIKPTLPKDIEISLMMDQSGNIKASVHTVLEHLILGGFLAGVMVLIFMGSLRSTFISFLAMPISIIGSFIFMKMSGFTIDTMTLLGLTVAVGIVIDDAIVMLENIFRHMEKYGKTPMQAAVDGSREITSTVVATTLSILVIFLPLAYMSGMIGRVVNSYGMTVVFAIALSGVVALTLTPMLCAKMLKQGQAKTKLDKLVDSVNKKLVDWYIPLLDWSIHHRKIMVTVSIFCIIMLFPMLAKVGGEFIPVDDSGKVQITVEAPVGTSYNDTLDILRQIEKDVLRLPHIKDTLVVAGVGSNSFADSNPSNKGLVRYELEDREKREGLTTKDYLEVTRQMMKKYKGLQTTSYIVSDGPSAGSYELQYVLSGPDLEQLANYGNTMIAQLSKDPRFIDLDLSLDLSKPEYRVVINRDKAYSMGVKVSDIASALRTMVGGEDDITKYKEGDDLYEVRVRVAEEYRDTKEAIAALMIPADNEENGIVRLDSVATIEEGTGPSQIDRFNRQRQVTVQTNLNGIDQRSALAIMEQAFKDLHAGVEYSGGVTGASQEMGKMFMSFIMAFFLAFLFKYMILAAQFESYTHPVAIIISLPLTIPFAVLSLLLTGQTMNVYSLLGIFMLVGVVSKNAILQTDYTNQLRARGYGRTDAILQANRVRLRPILMTTLTLIMGVAPMIISNGAGAEERRSLAIVIVGGQALSLLVTLLMTPVTYILLDEFGDWLNLKLFGIPIPQDKSKDVILPEVPEEE